MMLGNLTVEQIEKELQIELSKEDKDFLINSRQKNAENIDTNKWHCCYYPTIIMCGSQEFAKEIYDILSKYDCKCQIRIAW